MSSADWAAITMAVCGLIGAATAYLQSRTAKDHAEVARKLVEEHIDDEEGPCPLNLRCTLCPNRLLTMRRRRRRTSGQEAVP